MEPTTVHGCRGEVQLLDVREDDEWSAGRIDGASEFRIFWSVVLPLLKPALVTLGVFVFLYQWNEFIWTFTVTRTNPDLQPLTVGIFLMQSAYDTTSGQSLRQAALAIASGDHETL